MMSRSTVLFVDDEPHVLTSLERQLIREPYRKRFANSAEEALAMLDHESVQVVVSDIQMPGMDGLTFLQQVRQGHPQVVRMVFSGTAEIQRIIAAINRGEVYRYLAKPLNEPGELRAILRQAIEYHDLQQRQTELLGELAERNEELSRRQSRMDQELRVAGQVQRDLLSTSPVATPDCEVQFAYRPSLSVGGDFFDALILPDGRLCLYVGDVSGHGVGAALISTLLKMTTTDLVRAHIDEGPAAVCRRLNQYIGEHHLGEDLYATLFLALYEPTAQRWRACNCGHPMPILFSSQGVPQPSTIPDRGDLPLGVTYSPKSYAKDAEITWTATLGDVLLLFTDGLYEARHAETGVLCGAENLCLMASEVIKEQGGIPPPEVILRKICESGYQLDGDDCCAITARLTPSEELLLRLDVPCSLEQVSAAASDCEKALLAINWPARSATAARLLLMEYAVNIVRHGKPKTGDTVQVALRQHHQMGKLLIRDSGPAWDFWGRMINPPSLPQDATNGRGLSIIGALAQSIDFCRRESYNYVCFTLARDFTWSAAPSSKEARHENHHG